MNNFDMFRLVLAVKALKLFFWLAPSQAMTQPLLRAFYDWLEDVDHLVEP